MMTGKCKSWEIWFASVRFEDSPEIKKRPVVIFKNNIAFILAFKITTHEPRSNFQGEYKLKYWKEANLRSESTIRLSTTFKLTKKDLDKKIGQLHPNDIIMIQYKMCEI